ncbi:MAG: glycosyltransferase family 2 protein [Candidatus Eremiobacteraeota bacterium]|nr:glycosyltransferase family 2 protein [Candidatus Eremiobacteraeota bacterium]
MRNWIIGLIVTSVVLLAGLVWGLYNMRIDWLQAIMLIFTYYGMLLILVAAVTRPKKFLINKDYSPFISIVIPARNEAYVIANTVRSILKLDYKKDDKLNFEILVMDDNSSDDTFEIAQELEIEFPGVVRAVHRGPEIAGKGKSMVLNDGMKRAKGDIIAVFDADTNVAPNFFKNAIPLLYDPQVGGLQGRVRLYNRHKNLLTALQEDEFAVVSHLYQLGKELVGGLTALGGNGQLVKRKALDDVDGWNWLSPTEDLDLTFRLLFKGWHVRYAPDAVLKQEGVEGIHAFIRQRVRWAEGFLKCIFDYTIPLIFSRASIMKKLDGTMTMIRVLIPFFVWIGYIFIGVALVKGVEFSSGVSPTLMIISSWAFFGALTVAMFRTIYPNVFTALFRVIRYSFYNLFWVIAVPIGFVNCIRHINDIYWDKTTHTGGSPKRTKPSRPPEEFTDSPALTVAEAAD